MFYKHIPVLVKESIDFLNPKSGEVFVDCTLGGGGHTEKIKIQNPKLKIIGIDRDGDALKAAKERLSKYQNIEFVQDNFKSLKQIVHEKVDGILIDLGVSSYQINEAARGFSFQTDGVLDMRMDQSQKLTAADIVNNYLEEELSDIFKRYGEERFARRIARAVVKGRGTGDAGRTLFFKELVEKAIPTWKKRESLARIFQALRIEVNHELENLETALADGIPLLKPKGRMVVISYHSLEDRIVKQAFKQAAQEGSIKILTKKPVTPSEEEIASNPRSKSAKLRAAEKI